MPVKKFPSVTTTGYQGTGFSGVNNRNYYSLRRQRHDHQAGRLRTASSSAPTTASWASRPRTSASRPAASPSTASSPDRPITSSVGRNAIADLLLGYPSSGSFARNSPVNNFINYYSVYMQDDWRVSDKLTMNYGVRLEHETGLARSGQQARRRLRSRPRRARST